MITTTTTGSRRRVIVSMSPKRWNRLLELEAAYKAAKSIAKAKRECETAPSMSLSEAMDFIDTL